MVSENLLGHPNRRDNGCLNLLANLGFLHRVLVDYLHLIDSKHWPVVREVRPSGIVIDRQGGRLIVHGELVVEEELLELVVPLHEHAVAPGGDPLLGRGVVDI